MGERFEAAADRGRPESWPSNAARAIGMLHLRGRGARRGADEVFDLVVGRQPAAVGWAEGAPGL